MDIRHDAKIGKRPASGLLRSLFAGLIGGFVGQGLLGVLFANPITVSVLYNPKWQSDLFISITPQRNILISVAGLVVLSAIHGWLYAMLSPAIPARTTLRRGLFWGLIIWLMYWVFQEWFIYHTLLREPLLLNALELLLLLVGSLVEGIIIARIVERRAV